MKRKAAVIVLAVLLAAFCALPALAAGAGFADVPAGVWYWDEVSYVSDNGLMQGVAENSFDPARQVTRAMLVTVFYRMDGAPPGAANSAFSDVAADKWYAAGVAWAASQGIVNGYSETRFGPEDTVSREQLAAICYRYARYNGYDVTPRAELGLFADAGEIHDWAKDALAWCCAVGLMNGVRDDFLEPGGSSTRAQLAAILMRFDSNVAAWLDGDPARRVSPVDAYVVQELPFYSPWKELLLNEPNGAWNSISVSRDGDGYFAAFSFYRLFGTDPIPLVFGSDPARASFAGDETAGELEFSDGRIILTLTKTPGGYLEGTQHIFIRQ